MKSVTICGSNKFAKGIRNFATDLRKLGIVVYEPHLYDASGGDWNKLSDFDKPFVALGLTHDHFYKIRMGDVIYIYNKNGYSGNSTTLEIGYAVALNKPLYSHAEDSEEICRHVLFQKVIKTPKELAAYLK